LAARDECISSLICIDEMTPGYRSDCGLFFGGHDDCAFANIEPRQRPLCKTVRSRGKDDTSRALRLAVIVKARRDDQGGSAEDKAVTESPLEPQFQMDGATPPFSR
jgi:hypothetical protein